MQKNKLTVEVIPVGESLIGRVYKLGNPLIIKSSKIDNSTNFRTNKLGDSLNITCNKVSNNIVFTCSVVVEASTDMVFLVQEGVFILSDGKKLIVQKDE